MKKLSFAILTVIIISLFLTSCKEDPFQADNPQNGNSILYKGLIHNSDDKTELSLTNGQLSVISKEEESTTLGIEIQNNEALNIYTKPINLGENGRMEMFAYPSESNKENPIVGMSIEMDENGQQVFKGFANNSESVWIEAYKDGELVYKDEAHQGRWIWIPIGAAIGYILDHSSAHYTTTTTTNPDGTTTTTTSWGVDWEGVDPDGNNGNEIDILIDGTSREIKVDFIKVVAQSSNSSGNSDNYLEIKTLNIDEYTILDENSSKLHFLPSLVFNFGQPDFSGNCSGQGICSINPFPLPTFPEDLEFLNNNEAILTGTSKNSDGSIDLYLDATHMTQDKIDELFNDDYFIVTESKSIEENLLKHLNKKYGNILEGVSDIEIVQGEYELTKEYTSDGNLRKALFPIIIFIPDGRVVVIHFVIILKI